MDEVSPSVCGWGLVMRTKQKKGNSVMLLQGMVLGGDVLESTFYDQSTGEPKHGYSVKLTVLDLESHEKYECQLSEGFPTLEQLKDLKKQGQPLEVLQQAAAQLRGELPQEMSQIALDVRRIRGKGNFLTLVCRFAGVPAIA